MKIGVISDTHMPYKAKALPAELTKNLIDEQVSLILHAGDWTDPAVVAMLEQIAPVNGIAGNNDGEWIQRRFGRTKIIEIGDIRIGMVHGDGSRKSTLERAVDAFANVDLQLLIFGHSHIPYLEERDGRLILNPGSPTDKRRMPRYSYAIVTINHEEDDDTSCAETRLKDENQLAMPLNGIPYPRVADTGNDVLKGTPTCMAAGRITVEIRYFRSQHTSLEWK